MWCGGLLRVAWRYPLPLSLILLRGVFAEPCGVEGYFAWCGAIRCLDITQFILAASQLLSKSLDRLSSEIEILQG